MNNKDFEDIFLDNEKIHFQSGMAEEPIGDKIDSPNHGNNTLGSMGYAYRQDSFPFFRNDGQAPEWFLKNKKLPGLAAFITLGNPGEDDDNERSNTPEFEKMDIQSLVNQDFNFNLGRIFEESSGFSRKNSGVEAMLGHHDKGFRRPSIPARKHSRSHDKIFNNDFVPIPEKTSFFKGYLPMLLERNWKEILENAAKFSEFEQNFDAQKNVENLLFMEEHKDTHGKAFEEVYYGYYGKIISKLQECMEGYSLTGELILKVLYDEMCGLLSELFNFIRNCTSDYCFDLMKQKTMKNNRNAQRIAQGNMGMGSTTGTSPDPISSTNPAASLNNDMRLEKSMPPQQHQTHHQNVEYVSSNNWTPEAEETKVEPEEPQPRPQPVGAMTIENLESLSQLIDLNVRRREDNNFKAAANIPNYRGLENMSVGTSEIESVISDSARRSQRKYWSAAELTELDNLSSQYHPNGIPLERLEEFARRYGRTLNAVQSKISKTKKERLRHGRTEVPISGALRPTPASAHRKYEVSVEKMIKGALQQYPDNAATKEEIIEKIKEMFFRENIPFDAEKLHTSISQTLSASKCIGKMKGTFGLKSRAFMITNGNDVKTMKSRLQYILTTCDGNRADIDVIRRLYWDYFSDTVDADGVWETSITKVLKQSSEFDTSDCRTKYYLLARNTVM